MQLTKKQMEFWTFVLILCIGVSLLVMLIDFGIKAAILEESTRLRLRIEEWDNGRKSAETNASGVGNDSANNAAFPVPVLVDESTGMEAANVPNGTQEKIAATSNRRRPKSRRPADNPTIQDGNESVG